MCDTYCSIHGNNGYANAPQYYVLRTLPVLWGSVISKTGLYCTDSSLHNKHNYIYQHTAKRQIFEVDISMFLRQKFCGFGSVGKPISLSVVFHVHPKIQLFHPERTPPTHQIGIRRLVSHDAVVTGHEKQAFDSCRQMVLGTLCDVVPPDVTGPTLQDPRVVWSVHTKMMSLPETNMSEAQMKLRPQDMVVDIRGLFFFNLRWAIKKKTIWHNIIILLPKVEQGLTYFST